MNNGSVRGFVRNRYPINPGNKLIGYQYPDRASAGAYLKAVNRRAKIAARKVWDNLNAALESTGGHLDGAPHYYHLHPTKGYRKVPA